MSSLSSITAAATQLKDAGNVAFSKGDVEACLASYREALSALGAAPIAAPAQPSAEEAAVGSSCAAPTAGASRTVTPTDAERWAACQLQATLLSNSANALLSAKRFPEASASAQRAITVLGSMSPAGDAKAAQTVAALLDKARFRRATAESEQGFHFASLCELLQISALGADPGVQQLRRSAARGVGLAGLEDQFGIGPFAGGFTGVARDVVAAGSTLFTEAQLVLPQVDADPSVPSKDGGESSAMDEGSSEQDGATTTEGLVRAFSQDLLALLRSAEPRDRRDYALIARELRGSWPRDVGQVDADVLETVRGVVEAQCGPAEDAAVPPEDGLAAATAAPASTIISSGTGGGEEAAACCGPTTIKEQVTLLALQCRFNCFHRGFFRACALLNHSCNANAAMKYSPGRSHSLHSHLPPEAGLLGPIGTVSLVACRRISKGDEITVKYLDDSDYMLGVVARRELLKLSWLFECTCVRCTADLKPTAQTEWMRCTATSGCAGYVHLPLAPDSDTPVAREFIDFTRDCETCGKPCRVSADQRKVLYDVRARALAAAQDARSGLLPIAQHYAQVAALRHVVATHCHDGHWLHTFLLYHLCVMATQRVREAYTSAERGETTIAEAAKALQLDNFAGMPGPKAPAAQPLRQPPAMDLLGLTYELERRIAPFYPDDQLWALHVATGQLAVLVAAATPSRLPEVERVIAAKAPLFPRQSRPGALLRKAGLTAKQLKGLSKVL